MQRHKIHTLVTFVAITTALLSLYGCGSMVTEQAAKDQQKEQEAQVQPAQEPVPEPKPETVKAEQTPEPQMKEAKPAPAQDPAEAAAAEFENINFDFDKYDLNSRSRHVLTTIACSMFDRTELSLIIEGHCDERGSNEYNLALGERRAKAAKDYLIEMGVEPHRISTLSYGEEMPLDPGHNEEAWAVNRRAHFLIMH
ncbi:MAG: OmpA family protein [Candidatus Coatesbacteria bacterium]|nr:OmpA family protein [Candidatus Coatesbacteria bacterium]